MLKIISHFIYLDASRPDNTYPFCYMRQTHSILPQRLNMTILQIVSFEVTFKYIESFEEVLSKRAI